MLRAAIKLVRHGPKAAKAVNWMNVDHNRVACIKCCTMGGENSLKITL